MPLVFAKNQGFTLKSRQGMNRLSDNFLNLPCYRVYGLRDELLVFQVLPPALASEPFQ